MVDHWLAAQHESVEESEIFPLCQCDQLYVLSQDLPACRAVAQHYTRQPKSEVMSKGIDVT